MNDVEGRRTVLCEMNGTKGIEDENKNQRGRHSIKPFLYDKGSSMYVNRN